MTGPTEVLSAEAVNALVLRCLSSDHSEAAQSGIRVEGIATAFHFDSGRLNAAKPEIHSLLAELASRRCCRAIAPPPWRAGGTGVDGVIYDAQGGIVAFVGAATCGTAGARNIAHVVCLAVNTCTGHDTEATSNG